MGEWAQARNRTWWRWAALFDCATQHVPALSQRNRCRWNKHLCSNRKELLKQENTEVLISEFLFLADKIKSVFMNENTPRLCDERKKPETKNNFPSQNIQLTIKKQQILTFAKQQSSECLVFLPYKWLKWFTDEPTNEVATKCNSFKS